MLIMILVHKCYVMQGCVWNVWRFVCPANDVDLDGLSEVDGRFIG